MSVDPSLITIISKLFWLSTVAWILFKTSSIDLSSLYTGIIIEILIFTVIYFSIAYSLLEFIFKKKESKDERDDMINSKSYKLGYLLYEFSLFIFIGYVCSKFQNKELLNLTGNQELYNNFQLTDGGIVFFVLVLLAFISIIKSLYQFYLHRTV